MVKRIISIFLSVLLVLTVGVAFITTHHQNRSGEVSAAICTSLTEENKRWIIDRYGDCNTVEELIVRLNDEICTEYTYYQPPVIIIQHFDFDRFITTKKGLCYDYSCYLKIVFKTIFPSVKVHICDVRIGLVGGHSYNFIETGDKRYYVDLTSDQYAYNHNQKRVIYENIGEQTFEEYAAKYNEKIMNYH